MLVYIGSLFYQWDRDLLDYSLNKIKKLLCVWLVSPLQCLIGSKNDTVVSSSHKCHSKNNKLRNIKERITIHRIIFFSLPPLVMLTVSPKTLDETRDKDNVNETELLKGSGLHNYSVLIVSLIFHSCSLIDCSVCLRCISLLLVLSPSLKGPVVSVSCSTEQLICTPCVSLPGLQ